MQTILVGPQRFTTNATAALRSLDTTGPVATVNAGWEEREDTVGELDKALDHRALHLRLHHRFTDVMAKDATFAAAALAFRDRQDALLSIYRLRLAHALDGAYAVQRRIPVHSATTGETIAHDGFRDAVAGVRQIDDWYLARLRHLHAELDDHGGVATSGVIGWHREEIKALIGTSAALVIAGGNVAVLLRALKLFEVRIPDELPVVAWSAGAMALTDRVVLFHDFGPEGAHETEVFDVGLGRVPGIVALPHAKRRLRLDDRGRAMVLAERFAPAACLLLDDGAWVTVLDGAPPPPEARVLHRDGTVHTSRERSVAKVVASVNT